MEKTALQKIGDESQKVWGDFWEIVSPYRSTLWNYCLKLTGSPWEAEDLLQDTLLKAFASLSSLSHREQPLKTKSYLFRVATNHWLDLCRKKKMVLDDSINDGYSLEDMGNRLEVNEALELLLTKLPPRQAAVLILMESFDFTAKEVGELIATSEGSVNALLFRARKNLQKLHNRTEVSQEKQEIPLNAGVLNEFIAAYNRKDFRKIADMLLDEATFSFVEMTSTEYGKDTITKYSLNKVSKSADKIITFPAMLWGEEAIVFLIETDQGKLLHDVNTIEWEDGKIARWKCYYFCREFMQYTADTLGYLLEEIKWD